MAGALVAEVDLEAVREEAEEIPGIRTGPPGEAAIRRADLLEKAQAQAAVEDQPDHAQSRPAQGERVLAPRGLLVDRPEPHQRVELVGERHRDGDRIARHPVGGAERLVMLLDGRADAVVLALERRVFAAHQALELGELADHLGDEVGLGETGGALGSAGSAPTRVARSFASAAMRAIRSPCVPSFS